MKRIIFAFTFICLVGQSVRAQNVGINSTGATPRDCAMLDILSSNTGLLIPNLSLTATGTYAPATGTAVDGLLVFNTNAGITGTGSAGKGFYYWSTTASLWINLVDNLAPGSPWFLLGNTSITTPAAPATYGTSTIGSSENWMGTTDANDVVFGSNNIERMRIKTTGRVGIGTATPNSLLDITGTSASRVTTITNTTGTGDVLRTYSTGGSISAGYAALFADVFPSGAGSGYGITTANASTQSQMANSAGTLPAYSFGVLGNVYTTAGSPVRVGGVLGTGIYVSQWASLGYVSNAGTIAGLYVNSTYGSVSGGGRLSNPTSNLGDIQSHSAGVGIVSVADAVGMINKGGKAGMFVSGEKFGSFVDGVSYQNDISVQLNKSAERKIATYAPTSTSVDIQTRGHVKLVNGYAHVNFSESFSAVISEDISTLNITTTPIGNSNGLYIANVSLKGFDVYENNNGKSTIDFNWLAIGVKAGYEKPTVLADVLNIDFESNMKEVANNEEDAASKGKPVWWDGAKFRFDAPPAGVRPYAEGKKSDQTPNISKTGN